MGCYSYVMVLLHNNEFVHFHSNVTVLLDNNGFVAVTITMVTATLLWLRSVIDKREFRGKQWSCVLGSEEKGCIRVGSAICLCILRVRISGCISEGVLEARRHYTNLL
jgi:hypothetical protein